MIFFILVHIPLSRMHSTFGFLTAFIPIMLNIRTKYWFYETCNKLVCLVFKNDPEAKNHIKKPKDLKVEEHTSDNLMTDYSIYIKLSRDEKDQQENGVWCTVLFLSLFFQFSLNYVYQTFLQTLIVSNHFYLIML